MNLKSDYTTLCGKVILSVLLGVFFIIMKVT